MDKKHNSSRHYITFYHEIYTLHPSEMWHTDSLISNFNLNKMWNGVRSEKSWVKKEEIKVLSKETAKICIEKHNLTQDWAFLSLRANRS